MLVAQIEYQGEGQHAELIVFRFLFLGMNEMLIGFHSLMVMLLGERKLVLLTRQKGEFLVQNCFD